MFCKFNGLWQFDIALLSDAFFLAENILFFYFLLQSSVSLTKFLWKQKMSSFSLFVKFIFKMIDWISKTAILNGNRTFLLYSI